MKSLLSLFLVLALSAASFGSWKSDCGFQKSTLSSEMVDSATAKDAAAAKRDLAIAKYNACVTALTDSKFTTVLPYGPLWKPYFQDLLTAYKANYDAHVSQFNDNVADRGYSVTQREAEDTDYGAYETAGVPENHSQYETLYYCYHDTLVTTAALTSFWFPQDEANFDGDLSDLTQLLADINFWLAEH